MDYLAMIRIITYRLAMLAIFVVHFYAMCETADEQLMQKVPRPYLSDANDWREILYVAVPSYILLLVAFWHSQKWAAHVYIIGTQAGFLHGTAVLIPAAAVLIFARIATYLEVDLPSLVPKPDFGTYLSDFQAEQTYWLMKYSVHCVYAITVFVLLPNGLIWLPVVVMQKMGRNRPAPPIKKKDASEHPGSEKASISR